VLALAGGGAVVVAGIVVALVLVLGGNGPGSGSADGSRPKPYVATGPWRLQVVDRKPSGTDETGCTFQLTDTSSGTTTQLPDSQYGHSQLQIHDAGSFTWTSEPGCTATPLAGPGARSLPFSSRQAGIGDTDAFTSPSRLEVQVTNFHGGNAKRITAYDPATGEEIATAVATTASDTVTLDMHGHSQAYLRLKFCTVQVGARN
jgi:hypothetical protein